MQRVRYIAPLLIAFALFFSAGCADPRAHYNAITIGQPLPERSGKPPTGEFQSRRGYASFTEEKSPLPLAWKFCQTRALLDEDGRATAKSFSQFEFVHAGLFLAARCRSALEIEIPEENFTPAPVDWDGRMYVAIQIMLSSMYGMIQMEDGSDLTSKQMERLQAKLDEVLEIATSQPSQTQPGARPMYAVQWIITRQMLLDFIPTPSKEQTAWFLFRGFLSATKTMPLAERRELLDALTTPGADVKAEGLRVQSLPGRRVRLEYDRQLIRDPILPLLGVCY